VIESVGELQKAKRKYLLKENESQNRNIKEVKIKK